MSSKTKKKTLLSTFVGSVFNTFNSTRKKSSRSKPTLLTPRTRKIKLETLARKRATRKIAATLKNSFSSKLRKLKQNNLAKLLAKHKADGTVCSVCLEHVEDVNNATITSCNHLYHTDCIERWLLTPISKGKCANCKRVLVTKSGANLSDLLKVRNNTPDYNQAKHNDLIEKLRNLRNSLSVAISDQRWSATHYRPTEEKLYKEQNELIRHFENLYDIIVKIIEIYFEIFPNQKTRFNSINSESDAVSSMSVANKNLTAAEAFPLVSVNANNALTAVLDAHREPLLVSLKEIAIRIVENSA